MTLSIDGLVSGMDTTAIVTALLRAEANPQTLLKQKLTATQAQATAYRAVNTTFAAVRAAAEALSLTTLSAARKASSSAGSVTATAGAAAVDGSSLTFTVVRLASTQQQASTPTWSAADSLWNDQDASRRLEFRDGDDVVADIQIPAGARLTDVAALINDSDAGVRATIVQPTKGTYQLLLSSESSGTDGARTISAFDADGVVVASPFFETRPAADAELDLGGGLTASSSSNTFGELLTGVTVTVSQQTDTEVTVSVAQDADAVVTKVQALVDAANAALTSVRTNTNNDAGSTAALKGDYNLTSLTSKLLEAVSSAVGDDGSPVRVGLQLSRDGRTILFDKAKFSTALQETPELAERMISGRAASDPDGIPGNGDEVTAVTGIAARLLQVAEAASDNTTGSILALAKGKDSVADDLEERIEAWDLRLAQRKQTLTRQFTAMETALSSLRSQSSWLSGQLASLPAS